MRQGQDALIRVTIELHDACFGTTREIGVETAIICTKCGGDGCAAGTSFPAALIFGSPLTQIRPVYFPKVGTPLPGKRHVHHGQKLVGHANLLRLLR